MDITRGPFLLTLLISLCCIACESSDGENVFGNQVFESGRVQLFYEGIQFSDSNEVASFILLNDSTVDVQYFAYSQTSLHYSTEVLSDTGWVYLFWNWCGTGAEYHVLESGSSTRFETHLPQEDCTWRVLVNIADMEHTMSYTLRSAGIEFTVP